MGQNTTIRLGSMKLDCETKNLTFLVPKSRMAAIREFSAWKEGRGTKLAGFGDSVSQMSYGPDVARAVVSGLEAVGPQNIPTVQARLDSETLHLPPRIACLLRMALELDKAKGQKMASEIVQGYASSPIPMGVDALFADVLLGELRLYSISSSGEGVEKYYREIMKIRDPKKALATLKLDRALCIAAEDQVLAEVVTDIQRIFMYDSNFWKSDGAAELFSAIMSMRGSTEKVAGVSEGIAEHLECVLGMASSYLDVREIPEYLVPIVPQSQVGKRSADEPEGAGLSHGPHMQVWK